MKPTPRQMNNYAIKTQGLSMNTCSNNDIGKQSNMKNICVYNVPKVQ